ncbi:hypothetical protein LRP52_47260 [Photobacterium sp. ZSDE20]|nr:hypothetical protein [Photobacterium sp. ZSDE20]
MAALAGCEDDKNTAATEAQAIAAIKDSTWTMNGRDVEVNTSQTFPSTHEGDIVNNTLYYCGGIRCALDPTYFSPNLSS